MRSPTYRGSLIHLESEFYNYVDKARSERLICAPHCPQAKIPNFSAMAQYHLTTTSDRFVSLAQLCSIPAITSDLDVNSQEQLNYFGMDDGPPMSPYGTSNMKPEQQAMCSPARWDHGSPITMADMRFPMGEYVSSSPSDSPSPPGSVQQEQHQKRRAQNRAA